VREWQIWNEEGFNVFWATQPWPRTYTQNLRAAYLTFHHYDHGAKVVAGSLAADAQSTQWQQMSALYAAGARMIEMFPVVPLAKNQAVAVGITSYDGGVYYGLNADRDAMSDVDTLAALVEESLEELVSTVPR